MAAAPRPPSGDPLVALADRCVQCGLCLPACPTYRHDRAEPESPRGRIALGRAWALGTIEATAAGDRHLDNCLACRSCEAVCPAGVEYGALLLETRSRQRVRRGAGLRQYGIEWLTARPRLLGAALSCYRLAYRVLPRLWRPLPQPGRPVGPAFDALPASGSASAGSAQNLDMRDAGDPATVALFTGCVARPYEGAARAGLSRLLASIGIAIEAPRGQACCGTLHAHAGNRAMADRLAVRNRDAFSDRAVVLTLASGCHESVACSMPAGTRTMDALAFLAPRADRLRFAPTPMRIALHLPCTQRNVVHSVPDLRRLLAAVPELQVVELTAGFGCCGAAGSRMLTDPIGATRYRTPLVEQLHAAGVECLLSANIGCRLHLQNGTPLPVLHPIEFLAARLAALIADDAPIH